eukprot:gene18907-25466_t
MESSIAYLQAVVSPSGLLTPEMVDSHSVATLTAVAPAPVLGGITHPHPPHIQPDIGEAPDTCTAFLPWGDILRHIVHDAHPSSIFPSVATSCLSFKMIAKPMHVARSASRPAAFTSARPSVARVHAGARTSIKVAASNLPREYCVCYRW